MKSTVFNKIIFCLMSFFFLVSSSYAGTPLIRIDPVFSGDFVYISGKNSFNHQDYRLEYTVTSYADVSLSLGYPLISERVQSLGSCLATSIGARGTCSLVLSVSLDGLRAGDRLKIQPTFCNGSSKLQCYQSARSFTFIIT